MKKRTHKMSLRRLKKELKQLASEKDAEHTHSEADERLLEFIKIERYYA
jgi:hypothetical protein